MSTGPRSRPGGPEPVMLDGPSTAGFTTASTSGDGPRPLLPRTRAGAVAFPDRLSRAPRRGLPPVSADAARIALTRPPLTGADLTTGWRCDALLPAGGIAKMGDHWFDHGRQIPDYVADALDALCDSSAVALAEPDAWGMQRTTLTGTGIIRFQQVSRQRQMAQPLPASGSVHAAGWLADHPCAKNMVQSVWDTLAELELSCHHPGPIAALRQVLTHHQPTPTGRCRACRRWRWRRRRFPCIVWHQIHAGLRYGPIP
jgi:hypothetical protein